MKFRSLLPCLNKNYMSWGFYEQNALFGKVPMKLFFLFYLIFLATSSISAQKKEQLQSQLASKKDSIAAIQNRVEGLEAQIASLPGWNVGAIGTVGVDLLNFRNWYSQGLPHNNTGSIDVSINAFANLLEEKFFWRSLLITNFSWLKPNEEIGFEAINDVFNFASIYGRRLNEKWSVSGLIEYRSTVLHNINNPGFFDVGAGTTWTPVRNLVVIIHPLNYNFVFAEDEFIFKSSPGTKFYADYSEQIGPISLKSNLSVFQSYESRNLSNWVWSNSILFTMWKDIGVSLITGLRDNKQEALNYFRNTSPTPDPTATFDSIDNKLQTFWILGISYSL